MQTAKILPGKLYAIKNEHGDIVGVRVTSITTTKFASSRGSYGYRTTVDVRYEDGGGPVTLEASALLGPFEEYRELVEARRQKQAAQERADEERKEAIRQLRTLLYEVTNTSPPARFDDYNQPFRASPYDLTVNETGVKIMTELLGKVRDAGTIQMEPHSYEEEKA